MFEDQFQDDLDERSVDGDEQEFDEQTGEKSVSSNRANIPSSRLKYEQSKNLL